MSCVNGLGSTRLSAGMASCAGTGVAFSAYIELLGLNARGRRVVSTRLPATVVGAAVAASSMLRCRPALMSGRCCTIVCSLASSEAEEQPLQTPCCGRGFPCCDRVFGVSSTIVSYRPFVTFLVCLLSLWRCVRLRFCGRTRLGRSTCPRTATGARRHSAPS